MSEKSSSTASEREKVITEHKKNLDALSAMTEKSFEVMRNISALQNNYFHKTINDFIQMLNDLSGIDEKTNPHDLWQQHEERIQVHTHHATNHKQTIQETIEKTQKQIEEIFRERLQSGFGHLTEAYKKKNTH